MNDIELIQRAIDRHGEATPGRYVYSIGFNEIHRVTEGLYGKEIHWTVAQFVGPQDGPTLCVAMNERLLLLELANYAASVPGGIPELSEPMTALIDHYRSEQEEG